MRIAFVVNLFPPKWVSGTEIATYNFAAYLSKRGHEVHVITSRDDDLPLTGEVEGFYVHRLPVPRDTIVRSLLFCIGICRKLRDIRPDIVQCQGIGMGMPAYLARKVLKIPYTVCGQGTDVYDPERIIRLTARRVLDNASGIIALTNDMKKEMNRISDRPVRVIPNGIDLTRYENVSRSSCRLQLGIRDEEKIIVFVGRIRPVKGVPYLIEAMSLIRREDKSCRLMLVGYGDEENINGLIKKHGLEDCVALTGKVPNEEVPRYLAASDVFVLPSLYEGFGIVILEAMAAGLPVVTTNVGGPPDIVEEGVNGFLVEAKNSEQIADRVIRLLSDNGLREKMSGKNIEEVKKYSWESVAEQTESLFGSIIKG